MALAKQHFAHPGIVGNMPLQHVSCVEARRCLMKRVGNLFDAIVDHDNLLTAVWNAKRGRSHRPEVRLYLSGLDRHLAALADGLSAGTFPVGRFQQFLIRDPKERVITAPCFPERVLHHAIMNVCEPHFERWLISDTFACRAGKGRSAALARARQFAKQNTWFLSLDVRKYFDSIDHDVLRRSLTRRIKDVRVLDLFGRIIAGYRGGIGRGLPIGSLTSQHFANFYLDPLNRRSRVRYCRRMRRLEMDLTNGDVTPTDYQRRATALTAFATSDGVSSWRFRANLLSLMQVSGHTARTE
jgi:hypothetical protein